MRIRYTLLADGTSDRVLFRIVDWLFTQSSVAVTFQAQWAAPDVVCEDGNTLLERMRMTMAKFPCDLLLVHRDAEGESFERRASEISEAAFSAGLLPPAYCMVIPIRMTEAWLLFDENAIRRAAGNPHGDTPLDLPALRECESITDPKSRLHESLRIASGLSGRRARNFRPGQAVHRVASEIRDFSPLRRLTAFAAFEEGLRSAIKALSPEE